MDRGEILRTPWSAALFAAMVVALYRWIFKRNQPNHYYVKPAFLVGILVFVIVRYGQMEAGP